LPTNNRVTNALATRKPVIDIALCQYWWYFHDALENGRNRFPLPAPFL
jgi:hypothetical protein